MKLEIKAITKPIFEKYQIKKAYLFGSYARGEATTESDIDIMIAKKDSKITTLVNLTEFETELQEKLNKNVDVITEETYLDETVEENKYGKLETWIRLAGFVKERVYGYIRERVADRNPKAFEEVLEDLDRYERNLADVIERLADFKEGRTSD